jgi:hypothetical protein
MFTQLTAGCGTWKPKSIVLFGPPDTITDVPPPLLLSVDGVPAPVGEAT